MNENKKHVMLECTRPNGEKLVIPKPEPQSNNWTSRRGPMQTFKEIDGKVVLVDVVEEVKRPVHAIITDDMEPMRCYACKSWHTSKSKMRQCYKDHKMIEVGNESLLIKEDTHDQAAYDKQLEDDIAWAFNALKYGDAPIDELTKERCKIMDKQIHDSGDTRLRTHDGKTLLDGRE